MFGHSCGECSFGGASDPGTEQQRRPKQGGNEQGLLLGLAFLGGGLESYIISVDISLCVGA